MTDAKLIMKLRKMTGAGMMDCKKVLEEANDDFDKAIELLRKSGAVKAAKKADRETCEGAIRIAFNDDNKKVSIVQVNCETDFVAKNEDFIASVDDIAKKGLLESAEDAFNSVKEQMILKIGENIQFGNADVLDADVVAGYIHSNNKSASVIAFNGEISTDLGRDIAMHIVALSPKYLSKDDVTEDDLKKERVVYQDQLEKEGKPVDMIEKIIEGKLGKYYQEHCLLEQSFIKDEDKKIKDLLGEASIKSFLEYRL